VLDQQDVRDIDLHTNISFAGARVKIMRSIQIGKFKPKQSQIHDEHMQKEYQSQPLGNSNTRSPTSASASTQNIAGSVQQKLPNRTHILSEGVCLKGIPMLVIVAVRQ